MDTCIFTNKVCPYKIHRCLFYNNVAYFLDEKLVQYVLCQFNGEYRGGISITRHKQYFEDYYNMYCEKNRGENCSQFVIRCIREIYKINITGNILSADFTGCNINELKVIAKAKDLDQLRRGSLLFTIDTMINNASDIQAILRKEKEVDNIFSHVFFYLGVLEPSREIYIGGCNHASRYMPYGVAKFNDMFNLNNSELTYKNLMNHNARYKLLAATLV